MRRLANICLIEMIVLKTSRRFKNLRDGGRGENVPKGLVVAASNIVTKYLLKREFAFVNNPLGRLHAC